MQEKETSLSEAQKLLAKALRSLPIEVDSAVVAMFLCKSEEQTMALLWWLKEHWTNDYTPTQREIMDAAQRIHQTLS